MIQITAIVFILFMLSCCVAVVLKVLADIPGMTALLDMTGSPELAEMTGITVLTCLGLFVQQPGV